MSGINAKAAPKSQAAQFEAEVSRHPDVAKAQAEHEAAARRTDKARIEYNEAQRAENEAWHKWDRAFRAAAKKARAACATK